VLVSLDPALEASIRENPVAGERALLAEIDRLRAALAEAEKKAVP